MAKSVILSLVVFFLAACGSSEKTYLMPEGDANSQADGAAFAGDGMHFRKPMPSRPNPHPWKFYYKNCEKGSDGFFTSKVSYDCSEPF